MTDPLQPPPAGKKRRGFASMDPELQKSISRKGGKAAHAQGRAHEFTSEEAKAAGRKGGHATHVNRKAAKVEPKE